MIGKTLKKISTQQAFLQELNPGILKQKAHVSLEESVGIFRLQWPGFMLNARQLTDHFKASGLHKLDVITSFAGTARSKAMQIKLFFSKSFLTSNLAPVISFKIVIKCILS